MHASDLRGGWERLLWFVIEHSSTPIAVIDDERRFVEVNDAGLALLGRSRAELIGHTITDIIELPERAESARRWQAFLRSGEDMGTRTLLLPDGRRISVEFAVRLATVDTRRLAIHVMLSATRAWASPSAAQSQERPLTSREQEVITLIALGHETPQIASQLGISPETARSHVRNAMSKLGARTRAHLVALTLSTDNAIRLPSGQ